MYGVWKIKIKLFALDAQYLKDLVGTATATVSKSCNLWLVEKLGTYSFKEKDIVSKYIYEKNTFLEFTLDLINP